MISEFALFLFTTLAGAAAGAYVARAIVPLESGRKNPWMFPLVALVLLAISGVALLSHLGHPELVFNAFRNLGAGIAQEGVTTVLFGICVLVDCIFCWKNGDSPRWCVILTAVLGVCMTVAMGMAYAAFIGEPAWGGAVSIPFFVLGDLAMGAGLYLAFNRGALAEKNFMMYFVAAQVLAAIVIAVLAMQWSGAGIDVIMLIVGCLVGPVAAAITGYMGAKPDQASMAMAACVLAIVGMAIVRYAYYAASIF